ncbi:hypothetical protein ATANTOWER_004657 [Ataeniobius toweri]|uniref:Teneurin N-terminal domain-containing protein n=1 Tax=Ataeniobius toweri TaxID=208326 RepID=A0ABU7BA85_9TELE|nr:hypothetical protein [Ataeniobius toweri]
MEFKRKFNMEDSPSPPASSNYSSMRLCSTNQRRPLPPTSSSTLLPPSLPSSSSAPHHPSPGPSPPIRECQVPLLEKNSTHSHLEPHRDDSYLLRAQSSSTGAANHHSQSTLQPPLPPPHNHHNLSHQSANSLNRNNLRGGRNPIHAPAPGTGDGPTTPESVQLQDSWVLNSNVPLETRPNICPCSGGGVGHGSEPVALNGAQNSTLRPRLSPHCLVVLAATEDEEGMSGAAGACDWVGASKAEPKSHTNPVLAVCVLHLIITRQL